MCQQQVPKAFCGEPKKLVEQPAGVAADQRPGLEPRKQALEKFEKACACCLSFPPLAPASRAVRLPPLCSFWVSGGVVVPRKVHDGAMDFAMLAFAASCCLCWMPTSRSREQYLWTLASLRRKKALPK